MISKCSLFCAQARASVLESGNLRWLLVVENTTDGELLQQQLLPTLTEGLIVCILQKIVKLKLKLYLSVNFV